MLSFKIYRAKNVFIIRSTSSLSPSEMMQTLQEIVVQPDYQPSMGAIVEFTKGCDLVVMDWMRKRGIETVIEAFYRNAINPRIAVVLPGDPLMDNFLKMNYSFLELISAHSRLFSSEEMAVEWASVGADAQILDSVSGLSD